MSTSYVRVPATATFAASAWDFTWTMGLLVLSLGAPSALRIPLALLLTAAYPAMLWWATRPGPRNGITPACWMMFSRLRGPGKRDITFRALAVRRIPSLMGLTSIAYGAIALSIADGASLDQFSDAEAVLAVVLPFCLWCASILAAITFAILFRSKRLAERPQWLRDAAAIRVYGHADLWSPDSWPAPGNPFKRRRS